MTYALVRNNAIQGEAGRLPDTWTLTADPGTWITGLQWQPVAVQHATGWYEVATTPRPADTATTTFDRSLELVNGTPTETWTERPWTPDEQQSRTEQAERQRIEQAFVDALTQLDTLIAAPALTTVASGTLSTAQLSTALRTLRNEAQATRQGAQDLARIVRNLTRYVRGDFTGTD